MGIVKKSVRGKERQMLGAGEGGSGGPLGRMMSTRALEGFLDGCGALYAAMLFQLEQMLLETAQAGTTRGPKTKSGATAGRN